MIQIYSPDNKDYTKNGDMTLFPTEATPRAELNGAWSATLTHPIDKDGRWKYIVEDAVVKMPSFNGDQLFRIISKKKEDSGITAQMEPIFYDAISDCWLTDIRPTGKNGQEALDLMLAPNAKYSARSDITKANTAYYQYVNFFEALNGDIDQSFIKRWGGEILYDNFTIIVNERVGGDYGVELRYGKNIPENGLTEEIDLSGVVTRIYPKAYNGYTMTGNGYVDSPLINNYPITHIATITFDDVKMREDAQEDDEENGVIICDTQEELDAALRKKCEEQYEAGLDKPTVTISADMILLQNTEQYKEYKILETVSLGDTIHCKHSKLGIVTDARVISLEYDSLRKKVTAVTLGDFTYNYFNDVTSSVDRIDQSIRPDGTIMADKVAGILNGIYTQLRLQSTAAQKVDGVAFKVEDLDPDSTLYGCMIWGTQGLQISVTRTADGRDWDWTTAITAKGIVANAIITGILSDKLGRNYWNLDTGEFRLSAEAFQVDDQTLQEYVDGAINKKIETIKSLTLQLSNDFQGVATDADGNNGDYSQCYTIASLYIGTSNITDAATYEATPSDGVIGQWDNDNKKYTVTNMTVDTGSVTIKATYSNLIAEKIFSVAKVRQGDQGIPGTSGLDGKTSYFHVKYSPNSDGNPMSETPDTYIGTYVDFISEDSNDPSDYTWCRLEGIPGTDGIPGKNGKNGQTSYLHIKYSNDNGETFTENDGEEPGNYIGQYVDFIQQDSANPADYKWALIRGATGVAGPAGKDGKTSYFHVKYSENPNGDPMSETPSTYIGTYVDFSEIDSTDPGKYTWSRFEGMQGEQGIPGTNGDNGKTSYLHIKYSDDGGKSFTSENGETPGRYIGQYVDFTAEDSSDPADYKWSLTQGEDGYSYFMDLSSTVVNYADEVFSPKSITANAYYRKGNEQMQPYAGIFKIYDSTDGNDYTLRTTTGSVNTATYTFADKNVKSVRFEFYKQDGTTLLDRQTVSVVQDSGNGNLLKDTRNFTTDYWTISGQIARNLEAPDGSLSMASLKATNTDSYLSAKIGANDPISAPGGYTFSVWLRADKETTIKISLNHSNGVAEEIQVGNGWKQYNLSYNVETVTQYNQVTIGGWGSFSNASGATIYIWDPIVKRTLSSEEVFNMLTNDGKYQGIYMQNGQLYINGEYVRVNDLVSMGATIGGWKINSTNLKSPSGNLIIDSATGTIFTQRQNGNKGVTFYDDGFLFYSWNMDGNYIGRIGSAVYTNNQQSLYFAADNGDNLELAMLGNEENIIPYIIISDHDDSAGTWKSGINMLNDTFLKSNVFAEYRLYIGSTEQNPYFQLNTDGGLFLKTSRLDVTGIISGDVVYSAGRRTATCNNQIYFQWEPSMGKIAVFVDVTFIGYLSFQ